MYNGRMPGGIAIPGFFQLFYWVFSIVRFMNEHPATLLRCVVVRITYQNPENGYSVLKVKVRGYNDLVTLVGNLLEVPVGSVLLCRGEWKVDKRYGSQFVAATREETSGIPETYQPSDREGKTAQPV